jgi:hypothetical protein
MTSNTDDQKNLAERHPGTALARGSSRDQRSENLASVELPGQFVEHLARVVESPVVPEETEQCRLGDASGRSATVPGMLVTWVLRWRQTAMATSGAPARDGPAVMRRRELD